MGILDHLPVYKYKITLKEIATGETKELVVQINQKLDSTKEIIKHLFDYAEFSLVSVEEIPTIVEIGIEPYCPN